VYDIDTQQKHFYEESCYQLIESVMDGFNGTIFAYGQTGCGKVRGSAACSREVVLVAAGLLVDCVVHDKT